MTSTQRNAIISPATGLVVHQTDTIESLYLNESTGWKRVLNEDDLIVAPYTTKTATYTATASDSTIEFNTASAVTLNLPTAVGISGKIYFIKNINTGIVTVDANSTQTIDGQLTRTLARYESLRIQSNGSNWVIIGKTPVIMVFGHDTAGESINGSTTYYIGQFAFGSAAPTLSPGNTRRAIALVSGWMTCATIMRSIPTAAGTSDDSTLLVRNVTTSTNGVITSTIEYNVNTAIDDYDFESPLQITRGDVLEIQWQTGAWGTGANRPSSVRQLFNILIE
jgi:hypothetical protein